MIAILIYLENSRTKSKSLKTSHVIHRHSPFYGSKPWLTLTCVIVKLRDVFLMRIRFQDCF